MAEKSVRVRIEALISGYQAKLAQASASTRAFGGRVLTTAQKNSAAFTTMGIAAIAMGGAIAFGLKRSVDAAAAFESNLTKLVTQIDLTREEADEMGDAMLRMGETGKGPIELSEAMFFIQSAGARGAEALDILEASAKASAIGLGETKEVADLVTSAVNAYGSEALSAAEATDILLATVKEGKAEAPALASAFGKITPVASEMGISLEEVGAALAALTRTNKDTAVVSTQLRSLLFSLLKPSAQLEDGLNKLGLTGDSLKEIIGEQGLWAALQLLKQGTDETGTSMGQLFPNIRASAGALALTGANAEEVDGIFRRMADTTGLVDKGFKEWQGTFEGAKAKFSATMQAMQVSIGQVLLPALSKLLQFGTGVVELFNALPGPAKAVVAVFLAVASAMLLVGGTALLIAPRLAMARAAMAGMGAEGGLMRGSLAKTAAFLTGPFGIALVAATGLVMHFVREKNQARQSVDEFTAAVEADSGALEENTRRTITAKLQASELGDALRDQGISLAEAAEAITGTDEAFASFVERAGSGIVLLDDGFDFVNRMLQRLRDEMHQGAESAKELAESEGDAGGAAGDAAAEFDGLGDDLGEAAGAADDLTAALDELLGGQIGAEKAAIAWREAVRGLGDAIEDGSAGLTKHTEKADANRSAILDAVDAALEHGKAVADSTGSVEAGAKAVQGHIRELLGEATAAGISKKEIEKYIGQLNLTPSNIKTLIELLGTEEALSDFRRVKEAMDRIDRQLQITISVTGSTAGLGQLQHAGGVAGDSGARRMHSGGVAGFPSIRGNEVPTILERGELVFSKGQARALQDIISGAAQGPAVAGGGRGHTVQFTGPLTVQDDKQIRRISRAVVNELKKMEPLNA